MLNKKLRNYWNDEMYKKEKEIWGIGCSHEAKFLMSYLSKKGINSGTFLDIGCGYGRDSIYFNNSGYKVWEIDFAEEGIKLAEDKCKEIEFTVGNAQSLPYADNSFDICFCNYVIHWLKKEERKSVIAETFRVAKTDSIVAFSIPMFGTDVDDVIFTYEGETYLKSDIDNDFEMFTQKNTHFFIERHTHGGEHEHKTYFILLRK